MKVSVRSQHRPRHLGIGVFLLLTALAVARVATAADVRILIDVSGSMRQNDPDNLRVPAMRLVSELLPAGTTAGVWLFAEDAVTLLAPASVDDGWRARARKAIDQIHSRGLFTHIEAALAAASADWRSPVTDGSRHLVLLTDGVVDVSKDAADSAASRTRILEAQVAQLRASGAQVHAIALSENVDRELLETLTGETGGWLESARDSSRLQRIFLHMLEQSAAPDTVPITGNQFDIDAAVEELTLLVFRGEDVDTRLIMPDGTVLSADTAREDLRWRSEEGYDLVTVTGPAAGTWRFEGPTDPDNRAVIVTDLALELGPLPGTLLADSQRTVEAWLTEQGQPLSRFELLEIVRAEGALGSADSPADATAGSASAASLPPLALVLDRASGRFAAAGLGAGLAPGNYDFTVTVDGGTFKRERRQRLRIVPAPVTFEATAAGDGAGIAVTVRADPALTVATSLNGFVSVAEPSGATRAALLPAPVDGVASLTVPTTEGGDHEVAARLYITLADGGTLALAPPAQRIEVAAMAAPEPTPEPAPVAAAPPAPSLSWGLLAATVASGNLLLGLALGGLWWLDRRSRRTAPATPTPRSTAPEAAAA